MVMQNLVYLFSTGCFLRVIPKHMTTSGRNSFNQYLNPCYFKSELQENRALSRFFNPVFPEPRSGPGKDLGNEQLMFAIVLFEWGNPVLIIQTIIQEKCKQ